MEYFDIHGYKFLSLNISLPKPPLYMIRPVYLFPMVGDSYQSLRSRYAFLKV